MVSTPEEVTDVNPGLLITQTTEKKQVLENNCVYSPAYLMLKREQKYVVLNLQNKNSDPLKLEIACGPQKTKRAFKNQRAYQT